LFRKAHTRIADEINRCGFRTRQGAEWSPVSVFEMLMHHDRNPNWSIKPHEIHEMHEHAPDGARTIYFSNLLLEHFFDLPDLFLNFAGVFFGVAFGL
jgi:hypothetical protein